ncbi:MAG: hypothetical protein ACKOCX_12965, partial [Planctomycetota bacterium]
MRKLPGVRWNGGPQGFPVGRAAAVLLVACGAVALPGPEPRFAAAAPPAGFRELAPGVLKVIPADQAMDDALRRGALLEITEGQQALEWTP